MAAFQWRQTESNLVPGSLFTTGSGRQHFEPRRVLRQVHIRLTKRARKVYKRIKERQVKVGSAKSKHLSALIQQH